MANRQHLKLLKSKGPYLWNEWRSTHPTVRPDLQGANLAGLRFDKGNLGQVDLSGADLSGAQLWGANLTGADLSGANLRKAKLERAHLQGTKLTKADLSEADFSHTELIEAVLSEAIFSGATFSGANLSLAYLKRTNLQNVNFSGAYFNYADLSGADLTGADLSGSVFVRTDLRDATLTNCRVYGVSVWDVKLEGVKQLNLIITQDDQSTITVDDLEVAQFIYLLLNREKLRNVLNAVTKKGVLILGRFGGGGLEVLQAVADKLRDMSYLPIIFDFKCPQDHDYTETVKTLTGMVRFVIVDLSGPSVPQELYATVPDFAIPFVPIIEKGRNSYAMFVDLLKYDWVLRPPVEFTTVQELLARMPAEVIKPAEKRHLARQKQLDELFHHM
jgi:uncharacterized protein YjbI with pentapeptide repeats